MKCANCDIETGRDPSKKSKRVFCSKFCQAAYTNINKKTIKEVARNKQDTNRYTIIRKAARKKYLASDKPQHCVICGYALNFEVCHIKEISSFPKDTLAEEVNSFENLIALCRNHHWEHDHNITPTHKNNNEMC